MEDPISGRPQRGHVCRASACFAFPFPEDAPSPLVYLSRPAQGNLPAMVSLRPLPRFRAALVDSPWVRGTVFLSAVPGGSDWFRCPGQFEARMPQRKEWDV